MKESYIQTIRTQRETDSLTSLYINLPKLNTSLKTFEKLKYMSFTLEQKSKEYI